MGTVERRGEYAFEHTLHDGRGPMTIEHHFVRESQLPVVVQTWTLGPGAFEGMHRHDDPSLEELYLVMEGRARVRQGGREHLLGPGDSLRSPAGTEHDLASVGEAPLRVVVIWGPPGSVDLGGFGSVRRALEVRSEAEARSAPTGGGRSHRIDVNESGERSADPFPGHGGE